VPQLCAVGCYAPPMGGGHGVETFWLADGACDPAGSIRLESPSYLAWHPAGDVLYAVNETSPGRVSELRVGATGELELAGQHDSGGAAPCHLAVSPDARRLFLANYADGTVAAFSLTDAGSIAGRTDVAGYRGSGPVRDRQDGSHAHMAVPIGADRLVVTDLGADAVRVYAVSDAGRLSLVRADPLPPGTGPRQLVVLPADAADPPSRVRTVILGELSNTVLLLERTDAVPVVVDETPSTVGPRTEGGLAAHLTLSDQGNLLYVSNRGTDVVSVIAVGSGRLRPITDVPSGGAWPRHLSLAGDRLLVANQNSGAVAVFDLAPDGIPQPSRLRYAVQSPVCVVPRPARRASVR
jgi:6-phosphogluconolactonase